MPARNILVIFLALVLSVICYRRAAHNRYATAISEVIGEVDEYYVEEVDRRDLFEGSMRGLLRQLDPYSGFANTRQYEELLEDLDQKFGGVGIMVDVDPDSKRLMVLSPVMDSPAYRAGMRAGDLILEIDGEDTAGLNASDTVDLIRGKPGTAVELTILPLGEKETKKVKLLRAIIPVESVLGDRRLKNGAWEFFLSDHPNIGYVRLVSFGENSAEDLRKAVTSVLPNIEALIIDLRNNPGGLLEAAVGVCDLFLDEGQVVSINGRDGQLQEAFFASQGTMIPGDMPLVVLVDHYSASASEIVAACLQDYGRATVVGERTWGKGTVQSVIELEGGRSAMRLTTATYWRPSGRNIHRLKRNGESDEWGVTPDAGLEVKLDPKEFVAVLSDRRRRDVVVNRSGTQLDREAATQPSGDDKASPLANSDEATGGASANAGIDTDFAQTKEANEIVDASEANEAPDASDSSEDANSADEAPVVDRQLQRAVEFIQERLAAPTIRAA